MRTTNDSLCPNENPPSPRRHIESRTLRVVCDRRQVFKDNPGMGTPIIVEDKTDRHNTATLNCAEGEGWLENRKLTEEETEWLHKISDEANEWVFQEGKYATP